MQLKAAKAGKAGVKLAWKKVAGANLYVLYGNKCGKANKYKRVASTSKASCNVKSVAGRKIAKGTYYKFLVVALDKGGNVLSTSKAVHVATAGGKVGNPGKVKTAAKKGKVSLKVKKTFKLRAKAAPASKKLSVKKHRAIKYESSNPAVATASPKGVVKGVGRGSCYVFAYAQNGACAKVKVIVK